VDLTYLGAAQVDRFGNINTTLYGEDYTRPQARVSGSGGAHDLTVGANRVAVIMNHGVDRICDKLDYRTSPGFCEGGSSRWDVWGCSGGGPVAIFTNLAVLKPNPVSRELEISEIYPFTTIEEVKTQTGFDIKVADGCKVTPVPTDEETKVIREVLDAGGDFTGWTKIAK
jgi:glutaconate CoA-transferase subunit B